MRRCLDAGLAAGREAQHRFGVGFGLVVAANRNRRPQEATAPGRTGRPPPRRVRDHLGLTDEQLAGCARTSLRHSGAPPDLIGPALAGIDGWLHDVPA